MGNTTIETTTPSYYTKHSVGKKYFRVQIFRSDVGEDFSIKLSPIDISPLKENHQDFQKFLELQESIAKDMQLGNWDLQYPPLTAAALENFQKFQEFFGAEAAGFFLYLSTLEVPHVVEDVKKFSKVAEVFSMSAVNPQKNSLQLWVNAVEAFGESVALAMLKHQEFYLENVDQFEKIPVATTNLTPVQAQVFEKLYRKNWHSMDSFRFPSASSHFYMNRDETIRLFTNLVKLVSQVDDQQLIKIFADRKNLCCREDYYSSSVSKRKKFNPRGNHMATAHVFDENHPIFPVWVQGDWETHDRFGGEKITEFYLNTKYETFLPILYDLLCATYGEAAVWEAVKIYRHRLDSGVWDRRWNSNRNNLSEWIEVMNYILSGENLDLDYWLICHMHNFLSSEDEPEE